MTKGRSHTSRGLQAQAEFRESDGSIYYDYRTAHKRAGDTDYQVALPATCEKCKGQAEEAAELGAEAPTKPDADFRFLT